MPQPSSSSDHHAQSLDGTWKTFLDARDLGKLARWFEPARFPASGTRPLAVPGNINEAWPNNRGLAEGNHIVWYTRDFTPGSPAGGGRFYLRFGGVGYLSEVWLNGHRLGGNEGADAAFEFDVTDTIYVTEPNTLVVRVSATNFGGILQHVTLVRQPAVRIIDAFARPDVQTGIIRLEVNLENNSGAPAATAIQVTYSEHQPGRFLGEQATAILAAPGQSSVTLELAIAEHRLWNLEDPFLYAIRVVATWSAAPAGSIRRDDYTFRTGFRDFRLVDGYFQLNGKRLLLKSCHGNWYDPLCIQGHAGALDYLGRDVGLLQEAGFNMFRSILSAFLPEQLEIADEQGLLLYSEHETSWLLKDPAKFGISLNQAVRRDRNHPSLVIWGMLNETKSRDIYERAKTWLPSLCAIDDTRVCILSSGRWDDDMRTGSAANPGALTWDVLLGGEDAANPQPIGLPANAASFTACAGDIHVYQDYPTTWKYVTTFAQLAENTRPVFLSEAGIGSAFDAFAEKQHLAAAGASPQTYAWNYVTPMVTGMEKAWLSYGLTETYPSPAPMLVDSALAASTQRELTFDIVRSNPQINGYNLTSLQDYAGSGEGFINNFREFKAGHLPVLQAGWAPLRWCLLFHPTHGYTDEPIFVKVALANEDVLPGGDYPATVRLATESGATVWERNLVAQVAGGKHPPLASTLLAEEIQVLGLTAGEYRLEATLHGRPNAAAPARRMTLTDRQTLPDGLGEITVLGLEDNVRGLLTARGASLHAYAAEDAIDNEAILIGSEFKGDAAGWRALYSRIARGAHAVFLSPGTFHRDKATNYWLALLRQGRQNSEGDWLYHKDVIAKTGHPLFAGLETKLMTPHYYGPVLNHTIFFEHVGHPEDAAAVTVRPNMVLDEKFGAFAYHDGVMLGTYRHHAGLFTINSLNLSANVGHPAADRLLLNLALYARADAKPRQDATPPGYAAELDALGIKD